MTLEQEIPAASILVVDDQEAEVQRLAELLAEAGYTQVATTTDPAEVCALHERHAYDLILLDLQMPGMDGFSVLAELQAEARHPLLPVIALTEEPPQRLRAMNAGARDFISKPFDALEVRTRIHHVLAMHLLHRRLERQYQTLEQAVAERTAELRASEARYRALTELTCDWHWEQDERGHFTQASGPALDMLGLREEAPGNAVDEEAAEGWNVADRASLLANLAARRPFLDFVFHRQCRDGSSQQFSVSGQPMFDSGCRFIGYRGVGVQRLAGA